MPGTVQEFFETLPSRADTSKTADMNNSYAFDIEGAGQWTVKVTDGNVNVDDGLEDGADCTISASQEIFEKIIAGEQNPTSAYMTGKLKLKGDMGAAMKLQKLFWWRAAGALQARSTARRWSGRGPPRAATETRRSRRWRRRKPSCWKAWGASARCSSWPRTRESWSASQPQSPPRRGGWPRFGTSASIPSTGDA